MSTSEITILSGRRHSAFPLLCNNICMKEDGNNNGTAVPDLARVLEKIEEHLAVLRRERSRSPQDWLTIAEAASLMKVSRDTIERLVASGEIQSASIETSKGRGRRSLHRIRRDWLEDYLVSRAGNARSPDVRARPRRRRLRLDHDFFG